MVDARLCGKSEGLAKPYPVVGHLVDSAMVCGSVWDHVLAEGQRSRVVEALGVDVLEARRIVMFWAGLHDLGKIILSFQRMLLKARPARSGFLSEAAYAHDRRADSTVGRIRHESATHAALPQLLARLGYPAARGGRRSFWQYRWRRSSAGITDAIPRTTTHGICVTPVPGCPNSAPGRGRSSGSSMLKRFTKCWGGPLPPTHVRCRRLQRLW